ncbi:hypothetical protein BE20_06475, partial [Sorangium cellulosum]
MLGRWATNTNSASSPRARATTTKSTAAKKSSAEKPKKAAAPRKAAATKKAAAPRTAAASKKAPARQKSTASKKVPPPSPLPKLLGILESQKQLGGASYPPTIARLAELAGDKPTATINALITEEAKARVLLSRDAEGKKKPPPGTTLVLLAGDLQAVAQSDRLLELQLQSARKPDAPAVDLAQLPKGLLPALGRAFKAALEQRLAERRLPRTIGALAGKKPLFFFLADAAPPRPRPRPTAPPAPRLPMAPAQRLPMLPTRRRPK